MQRLQAGFRAAGIETLYTVIERLTHDGRYRSLDYKITGFDVRKVSKDAKGVLERAPVDDKFGLPYSSSIEYFSTHSG